MPDLETAATAEAADTHASYYTMARSWADDRHDALLASRRIAWIVAAIALAVVVLEALALVALAPLKTVVPYTLMVDRSTGYAQVLEGTRTPTISPESALTQSLLAQYVVARETFDINSLPDQYRKVALWSADSARNDYLATMPASNPASPINVYPRTSVVQTRIESLSPIAPLTMLVRFVTERRDASSGQRKPMYWAAVVKYRFSGEPMAMADRLVNPLGFQVVSYRRDQEMAPPGDAAGDPAAAPQLATGSDMGSAQ